MTTEQKGRCVGDPTKIYCNPPVPPIYGTSSAQYPPLLSTPSYPQPIPLQQFQPAPLQQHSYFTVPIGYQSYACPIVVTDGLPVKVVRMREPPLTCEQEVMKVLEARKQERLRKQQQQSQKRIVVEEEDEVEVKVSGERPLSDQMNQEEAARIERHKPKTAQSTARARE